jgi:hypothetical protein
MQRTGHSCGHLLPQAAKEITWKLRRLLCKKKNQPTFHGA